MRWQGEVWMPRARVFEVPSCFPIGSVDVGERSRCIYAKTPHSRVAKGKYCQIRLQTALRLKLRARRLRRNVPTTLWEQPFSRDRGSPGANVVLMDGHRIS